MHQNYIIADPWSIIEEGYEPERFKSSESLFSLGNGAMGQGQTLKSFILGHVFKEAILEGFIILTKPR